LETFMRRQTVDYSKDRPDARTLLNRGYFLSGLPRLILGCRLLGHRPVVDGYNSEYGGKEQVRWVICDRCGIRPEPQGHLDPDQWNLGQCYTGPFNPSQPMSPAVRKQLISRGLDDGIRLPGAWPAKPTGDIGAQLVIGRTFGTSIDFKVGNPGSEQCLAAHISIKPIGALYVHTEDHGQWIQRRLNATKYESRETGLRLGNGCIEWRIWASRNHSKRSDPWWMRGSLHIDPRHYLFGPYTCEYTKVGDKVTAAVSLDDGTEHVVTLRLERYVRGRKRQKKTTKWLANWATVGDGIPISFDRHVSDCDVSVDPAAATDGRWAQEAPAQIAAWVTARRAACGYQPTEAG
jgi:hypothetical protein